MKKFLKFIVFSAICCLAVYLCAYFSTVIVIKKAIISPVAIKPDMYLIYYDYYADCWSITDGCNMNDKVKLIKVVEGPNPKDELSIDIWCCNSFVIYGTIQKIEEDESCEVYTIHSTDWDIITQDNGGINRRNPNCRPKKENGLTIYDYKWVDVIAQPDDYIL
jgi:hypothetical protein